jgi:hypothetical protein
LTSLSLSQSGLSGALGSNLSGALGSNLSGALGSNLEAFSSSAGWSGVHENFLSIAFEYCLKGDDLRYLLNVWKKKK